MSRIHGYIGTYASPKSEGIYRFDFDTKDGAVSNLTLVQQAKNAKYVAQQGNYVASPMEEQEAGICLMRIQDEQVTLLHQEFHEEKTACYVVIQDSYLYTSNYHEGTCMIYKIDHDQFHLEKKIEIAPMAGCHQVIPHESYLGVPCLELDKIIFFDRSKQDEIAFELNFPKGSGPRHGVFNKAHTRFYVISERSNQVFAYEVQGFVFTLLQVMDVLEQGPCEGADSAAIRLSKDERFLYVSTRGINLISVIALEETMRVIQWCESGGDHPRDFILSFDEAYVLVVNRLSNNIVVFKRNAQSGKLSITKHILDVHEGVSILFAGQ